MARIAGVDLPREKRSDIGLTYVFGIGRAAAETFWTRPGSMAPSGSKILVRTRSSRSARLSIRITRSRAISRKTFSMNIKRLIDTGTYRGLRHRKGLPVRGQRSKTNARTRKGRRAGVGSKPKPPARPAPTA